MIGAPLIGSWIAQLVFWVLLVFAFREQGFKLVLMFVALWIGGLVASGYVLGGMLFAPYVAVLDIALVFIVFKGDVRLG